MKNIINFLKNSAKVLVVAGGIAVGASHAMAQTPAYYAGGVQYLSDNLLNTNTAIQGGTFSAISFATNFTSANYAMPANPNIVANGYGVFPISPAAQFITFQLFFQQYSNQVAGFILTNSVAPVTSSNSVISFTFQPILDDKSLQFMNQAAFPTNNTLFSAPCTIVNSTTNAGGGFATFQVATTNFLGAKYGLLWGASGSFTNALYLKGGMRYGEWSPAK